MVFWVHGLCTCQREEALAISQWEVTPACYGSAISITYARNKLPKRTPLAIKHWSTDVDKCHIGTWVLASQEGSSSLQHLRTLACYCWIGPSSRSDRMNKTECMAPLHRIVLLLSHLPNGLLLFHIIPWCDILSKSWCLAGKITALHRRQPAARGEILPSPWPLS